MSRSTPPHAAKVASAFSDIALDPAETAETPAVATPEAPAAAPSVAPDPFPSAGPDLAGTYRVTIGSFMLASRETVGVGAEIQLSAEDAAVALAAGVVVRI